MQKVHIQEAFQELLNELLETRPNGAHGVLARLFKKRALPLTIEKVASREVLDSRGNLTVEVDVYAKTVGARKLIARSGALAPRDDTPFPEKLRMVAEVYQKIGGILAQEYGVRSKNLGDEGGYAPFLDTPERAIAIIEKAIQAAG